MDLDVIILAAGKGTRMRSGLAKVLHQMGGKPLLAHVIDTAREVAPRTVCTVIGHQGEAVQQSIDDESISWVNQAQQLGTGHAVREAMGHLKGDGVVLVLYGDVPLIRVHTLKLAIEAAQTGHVGLVTSILEDAAELGRIVRGADGNVERIVEFKDASHEQTQIKEINSGILAAPAEQLSRWLGELNTDNAQGELYLTDIIEMSVHDGVRVESIAADPVEVIGVNDRIQLAEVERIYQTAKVEELMLAGVTVADPSRVDIRGDVSVGMDCSIDVNVVFEGRVVLGTGVKLGPGVVVRDSVLGDNTVVHEHSSIDGATIANDCSIGPFARVRPQSVFDEYVRIGNFVETKKSHLGVGTKANHLAYLGDATFGSNCNVGAGVITANYDGVNKFATKAGDNVFVGTNSTMIAPVELEDWAFVAAGSTINNNVSANALAVARGKQRTIPNWKRPDQLVDSTKAKKD